MPDDFHLGERLEIHLDAGTWGVEGWFEGTLVRIDPYSQHRSFYWVELDGNIPQLGKRLISVLNPKNIRKRSQK